MNIYWKEGYLHPKKNTQWYTLPETGAILLGADGANKLVIFPDVLGWLTCNAFSWAGYRRPNPLWEYTPED